MSRSSGSASASAPRTPRSRSPGCCRCSPPAPRSVALGDDVEYAVYGARTTLPGRRRAARAGRRRRLGVSAAPVPDGWETALARAPRRRSTVGALTIRPPWLAGEPGTWSSTRARRSAPASHPTTRLCLELLQRAEPGGRRCATGARAAACWRRGRAARASRRSTAIELDPAAVARDRGQRARPTASRSTRAPATARRAAPWAPTVVAEPDAAAAPRLAARRRSAPPERLIASGCSPRTPTTSPRLGAARAASSATRRELDGWAALVLERGVIRLADPRRARRMRSWCSPS